MRRLFLWVHLCNMLSVLIMAAVVVGAGYCYWKLLREIFDRFPDMEQFPSAIVVIGLFFLALAVIGATANGLGL